MKHTIEMECGGYVKWHSPNVIEKTRILGKMGVAMNKEKLEEFMKSSDLVWLSDCMENVNILVDDIKFKSGDKVVTSWESALDCEEFAEPLSTIAAKFLEEAFAEKVKPKPLTGQEKQKAQQKLQE